MPIKCSALASGGNINRRELDDYPTPPDCTIALLDFLQDNGYYLKDMTCTEPACGDGLISVVLERYFYSVYSCDIKERCYGVGQINYLEALKDENDCLITNPPFNVSEQFIRKALSEERKIIAMLLKSQYWHAKKRFKLFKEHTPSYILPLTWRPDFEFGARSGSPTMEVLWTVWIAGNNSAIYCPLKKSSDKNLCLFDY